MRSGVLRYVVCIVLALLGACGAGKADDASALNRPEITATFSIVAVDPENRVCGAAVASKYPAVGKVVPYVRAEVGALCTQHHHVPKWGEPALDMLQQGKRPEAVIFELLKDDPDAELRQLAVIDMQGRAAVHNPTAAPVGSRYWAATTGRFYCCQGNTLTGRAVVAAMAAAYEDTKGSLADRLMAALVAADCAGGDHRGRLAAGIRVAKKGVAGHWLALDVDRSDDAVIDLLKKYAALDHAAKGDWRGGKLPFKHPCPNRVQPTPPTGLPSAPEADTKLNLPSPPAFWKSRLADVADAVGRVKKGTASVLAATPGGRKVHLIAYGKPDPRRGTANYNSAAGGRDPASYARKDGTQKPVVFLLGPVHGQEVEGIAGLLNLVQVAETGQDLRGRTWKPLAENLSRCRVLIVPCGSPDARARCPIDSWVGANPALHERIGMGTKPDGANHTWPQTKRIHPMLGPQVKKLGAYWNDRAINLMHDEWFDPMTPETLAYLRLVREEAPDFVASLHSHSVAPSIEPTAYVPWTVKQTIQALGDRLQKRYAAAGLPHREGGPKPEEDGAKFPPPSFNLASALHHACGGVSFVHETPCGVGPPYPKLTHEQLLDIQMLLYDELFRFAVENPVNWRQ